MAGIHHYVTGHGCYENIVARIPSLFHPHITLAYQLMKKHSSYFSAHLFMFLSPLPSPCTAFLYAHLWITTRETKKKPHHFVNCSNGATLPLGLFSSLLNWGQKTSCLYIQYFSAEWTWKSIFSGAILQVCATHYPFKTFYHTTSAVLCLFQNEIL